jgi:hypothetical protein
MSALTDSGRSISQYQAKFEVSKRPITDAQKFATILIFSGRRRLRPAVKKEEDRTEVATNSKENL